MFLEYKHMRFNSVWISLYWIYWFYASRQDFHRRYEPFFSPNHSNKNHDIILKYYMTNFCKMIECNSHETHNI